jgi:DNA-binding transcriptional LysR family regulator
MDVSLDKVSTSDSLADGIRLESLPRELGVLLVVAGVGGVLLPGPVGTPFLILGGLILFPNWFRKVDQSVASRFPRLHREGTRQALRFIADLERRYPTGL